MREAYSTEVAQCGLRHTFRASAVAQAAEPHAEDRDAQNDDAVGEWVPTDAKPRSLPSTININKKGVTPFAVLSAPDFDAGAEGDRSSLHWGRDRE